LQALEPEKHPPISRLSRGMPNSGSRPR